MADVFKSYRFTLKMIAALQQRKVFLPRVLRMEPIHRRLNHGTINVVGLEIFIAVISAVAQRKDATRPLHSSKAVSGSAEKAL